MHICAYFDGVVWISAPQRARSPASSLEEFRAFRSIVEVDAYHERPLPQPSGQSRCEHHSHGALTQISGPFLLSGRTGRWPPV